jgi:hypothetical protein
VSVYEYKGVEAAGVARAPAKLPSVLRLFLIAAAGLAVLLVASQFVLPPLAADRVENRLTEGGGNANVSLSAFPAVRLLFGDGKRIEVRGSALDLDLDGRINVFDKLDGFDDVDLRLDDFRAGPFQMRAFELVRDGSEATYHLISRGRTTAAAVAAYGATRLGLLGGSLLGAVAAQLTGNRPFPIDLDMQLRSEDGRVVVVSGGGTIAGLPAAPLAQLITSAIVVEL